MERPLLFGSAAAQAFTRDHVHNTAGRSESEVSNADYRDWFFVLN